MISLDRLNCSSDCFHIQRARLGLTQKSNLRTVPNSWNSLSVDLRSILGTVSIAEAKFRLQTYIYDLQAQYYDTGNQLKSSILYAHHFSSIPLLTSVKSLTFIISLITPGLLVYIQFTCTWFLQMYSLQVHLNWTEPNVL